MEWQFTDKILWPVVLLFLFYAFGLTSERDSASRIRRHPLIQKCSKTTNQLKFYRPSEDPETGQQCHLENPAL
ncbi:hypothetical protein TNCV_1967331 [Trichonephila clavipes]|nr:hypothetical protein TNCV_1967331 [Trichonephila clavipes]